MNIEKKNIFLVNTLEVLPFSSDSRRTTHSYPKRENPAAHAAFISRKLQECRNQNITQKQIAAIRYKEGVYLVSAR